MLRLPEAPRWSSAISPRPSSLQQRETEQNTTNKDIRSLKGDRLELLRYEGWCGGGFSWFLYWLAYIPDRALQKSFRPRTANRFWIGMAKELQTVLLP